MALLDQSEYHYFDVRGLIRVFDVTVHEDEWSMVRIDDEFSQRFVGRFQGTHRIDCVGERSDDSGATWQPDFTMQLNRIE